MKKILKNSIYGFLNFLLGNGETAIIPILNGKAKGVKMRVNLLKDSAYILGKYDTAIIENIEKLVKPGWVLWDIGIYIGFYSLFFAKLTGKGGKVLAFEPDQVNLEKAKENATINGMNNIQFVNVAISNRVGQIDFVISGNTNSHLPGGYIGTNTEDYSRIEVIQKVEKVDTLTLDAAAEKYGRPDLVKIDIEGFELYALDHAHELANKHKPIFLIESHNPETDRKIFNFAKENRYTLVDANTMVRLHEPGNGTFFCIPQ